jgi:dipeptidyl aminopeptidase/acylaminoacyl peptidase
MPRTLLPGLALAAAFCGCDRTPEQPPAPAPASMPTVQQAPSAPQTLADARRGFQTVLIRKETANEPVEEPPEKLFEKVTYPATPGMLAAYVTPDPGDGKKHPAIVWITGGDCNTIGDVWSEAEPDDDQTAAQYRKAGLVMMFPSLRGGNENPGFKEGFLGEVEDVLAAAEYLGRLPYVDPERIYLGGHSTGGTLALLVAESSDRFKAVFSFGPVGVIAGYGPEFLFYDISNSLETKLRTPLLWLDSISTPTFVIEGTEGNIDQLKLMQGRTKNPQITWLPVAGQDHFAVLAPVNGLIAKKIAEDSAGEFGLTESEVIGAFGRRR